MLFMDVVGSTPGAATMGDRAWREVLADYQRAVRQEIERFRGTEIDSVGDGFLIAFDGTARALRCAAAARDAARAGGLELRAGVHAASASEVAASWSESQSTPVSA